MSTALAYHTATKYSPESIGGHPPLDWATQPPAWKDYDAPTPIELAPFLPFSPNPFTRAVRDHRADDADCQGLTLGGLSRLVYFTYGVTGAIPGADRPTYLRASPSAGGVHPTELYLVVRSGDVLPPGLYGYLPVRHALTLLWEGVEVAEAVTAACYGNAAVAAAPWLLLASGVFERSRWRYGERAYRRVLLDTGHLLGNALLAAPALGLRTHLTSAFCDDRLNLALHLDPLAEGALAVVAINAPGPLERPAWTTLPSPVGSATAAPTLAALHAASRCPEVRPRPAVRGDELSEDLHTRHGWSAGPRLLDEVTGSALTGEVLGGILYRRSTRTFTGAALTRAVLARILAAGDCAETIGLGAQPGLDRQRLLTFVATPAIDGLEPALWYLAPEGLSLRLVRSGIDRGALGFLCLGQDLGRDAAAVVFHAADLPRAVREQGDRAYRNLHLDAGLLGQRIQLAALAEDAGASGIGGFFDDHVSDLLGIPREYAVVYLTVLGVPR